MKIGSFTLQPRLQKCLHDRRAYPPMSQVDCIISIKSYYCPLPRIELQCFHALSGYPVDAKFSIYHAHGYPQVHVPILK
eukprot:SAG31_NODE_3832_length_3839_cov_7.354813_1_plen_79_part_00